MTAFSYDAWAQEQFETVRSTVARFALSGLFGAAVYVMPSQGKTAGYLVASLEPIPGAVNVLRFPGVGSRVSAISTMALHSLLWQACRREPICPTEG